MRARYHHWREEFNITPHEMDWVTRYFLYQMRRWAAWKELAITEGKNGHASYAEGQMDIWMRLAEDANKWFSVTNHHYQVILLV